MRHHPHETQRSTKKTQGEEITFSATDNTNPQQNEGFKKKNVVTSLSTKKKKKERNGGGGEEDRRQ